MSADPTRASSPKQDETTVMPERAAPAGKWTPPSVARMQSLLPQYEFIAMLGAGGMGAVYQAIQVSLDRLVAIKILPPGLVDDVGANFAERFKQEARTMARMSHPCIVNVYDFGQTAEGLLYFVMEYIEGTDLQKLIRENTRLAADDALAITSHVCDALEYAHARGVIHRDIKPANVLISADGVVKIADFGLAKAVGDQSHELTRSNMAMGTPHFMAPETMIAKIQVDARADLYAVGVMLHTMLTGEIPTGRFELPSKKTGCDPRFDAIVDRAMQADRELRYQSAGEIRRALDTILTAPVPRAEAGVQALVRKAEPADPATRAEARTPARPPNQTAAPQPPQRPSRTAVWMSVSVSALALAGLLAWSPWKPGAPVPGADLPSPVSPGPAQGSPSTPAPGPAPTTGWVSLMDRIDPAQDAVKGTWTRDATGLLGECSATGLLQLPYEPPEEYDFRIAYTSTSGQEAGVCSQILTANGYDFRWQTQTYGIEGDLFTGFARVSGRPIRLPSASSIRTPEKAVFHRRYVSLVEVRRDRVSGSIDGKTLVELRTDYTGMMNEPVFALRDAHRLGISMWRGTTRFDDISVRPVTGAGKFLR